MAKDVYLLVQPGSNHIQAPQWNQNENGSINGQEEYPSGTRCTGMSVSLFMGKAKAKYRAKHDNHGNQHVYFGVEKPTGGRCQDEEG